MNRKLHNSLMAMLASCTLLVVGLLAAVPARQSLEPQPMTVIADATSVDNASVAAAQPPLRKSHARGQTVQMPFFSFVPRG